MKILTKIIKNNKFLFKLALFYKETTLNKQNHDSLSKQELKYLKQLEEKGVATIPNFFSGEECQILINDFEDIDEKYARFSEDKRIFGIEKLSSNYKTMFYNNKIFKKVGEAYVKDKLVLQTTMAAKIIPKKSIAYGSGGGWHRDSFSKQFKAILYLSDVSMDNGPFMYIHGSHKMKNIKKIIDNLKYHAPGNCRYSDKDIEKCQEILNQKITHYTSTKGTVILVDSRGIHTGMPIKKWHRYSVFNYYIAKSFYQKNNQIDTI